MPYRLKTDEPVASGLRRIAAEQVEAAISRLRDEGPAPEAVHEARKSCKKVRAVLRLARGAMGEKACQRENARYRDAARLMSALRDSQAMIETLDAFESWLPLRPEGILSLREALCARRDGMLREARRSNAAARAADMLAEGLAVIPEWSIPERGFGTVSAGLKRVYGRGRDGLRTCRKAPSEENLHDWRKRAKYLRYQLRILRRIWPAAMGTCEAALHDLTDRLGEDHDLAVFQQAILRPEWVDPASDEGRRVTATVAERRARAQAAAWPLALRIYAEKPKDFVGRLGKYWGAPPLPARSAGPGGSRTP